MAILAINGLIRDISDPNPLIRSLAIRTMSYIPVPKVTTALIEPLRHSMDDQDAYVAKTACMAVAKLYAHVPDLVRAGYFRTRRLIHISEVSLSICDSSLQTTRIVTSLQTRVLLWWRCQPGVLN